jgi:hypothetical protein
VGKGASAPCPPSITGRASKWWARFALPTLRSVPVCSCAPLSPSLAHETAGAASTRHSLLPHFRGKEFQQTSGAARRENARSYSAVIPGRAKREPGIHRAAEQVERWIPGLRQVAHPGMTGGESEPWCTQLLRGANATKQSMSQQAARWIASLRSQ